MKNPLVTVHITSYNRFLQLKSLVESFVQCNEYENVEMIIVDNGSTDYRLLDYYQKLDLPFPFRLIRNETNDYPRCIWRAKNQARAAAKGKYFLDIPDDHQFVRKGNWIGECLDIYASLNKVGCIVLYAYPIFRWTKPNNRLHRESSFNDVPFYISHFKGYVDYNFMSRKVYEEVGPFLDTGYDNRVVPEPDYMRRCTALGLRRLFLKYPASVPIPDYLNDRLIEFGDHPVYPYLSLADYSQWTTLPRPVSAEEIRHAALLKHLSHSPNQSLVALAEYSMEEETSALEETNGNTIFDSSLKRMGRRAVRFISKRLT